MAIADTAWIHTLKGRITLDTKLVFTVGELAYLSNTWSLRGTGPDGNPVVLGTTTAEVARRQSDGTWRYVIDNVWAIKRSPDDQSGRPRAMRRGAADRTQSSAAPAAFVQPW